LLYRIYSEFFMRLAQICAIQSGYTARVRLEPAAGGVPAIQLRDLAADGGIDPRTLIRVDLGDMSARHLVSSGDVLFRSRGDRNTATALDSRFAEPALAVLPLMVLRPKAGLLLPDYLAWAINQPDAQRHFDATARGTSIRMVPKSALDDLELDIPDLEIQARIVAIDRLAARECALTRRLAEARKTLTSRKLAERARGLPDPALPERSHR